MKRGFPFKGVRMEGYSGETSVARKKGIQEQADCKSAELRRL